MRLFIGLIAAIMLSGCGAVAQKKADELLSRSKVEDWGVLDSSHETAERAYILQTLKDPDSAKIRFLKPQRDVSRFLGEPVLVWISWAYVNAKNSFGGYVGDRPYGFAYRCSANSKCQMINYAIPHYQYPDEPHWQK